MHQIEVEVKIVVRDRRTLLDSLAAAGAKPLHPREFEDNRLYDFPDRSLAGRGAMLRVRTLERAAILTFKDRARTESGFKVREEIESTLPPTEALALESILAAIGLRQWFRYQKYRTTWDCGGVEATLDETPIGEFLELEGERAGIDRLAVLLGYSPSDYIPSSYHALYLNSPEGRTGPADQMVFTK